MKALFFILKGIFSVKFLSIISDRRLYYRSTIGALRISSLLFLCAREEDVQEDFLEHLLNLQPCDRELLTNLPLHDYKIEIKL